MVVFGGQSAGVVDDAFWVMDACAVTNTWQNPVVMNGPGPRVLAASTTIYPGIAGQSSSRILIFGGADQLGGTETYFDDLWLVEVDSGGGLTATSLAPEQAAHLGISFPELCAWMVEDASCQR